jgi:hypothetical protein
MPVWLMPFTLDRFAEVRDYLYHNTSRANLPLIMQMMRLDSAATILDHSDRRCEIHVRRVGQLALATSAPLLQSQRLLIEKNIRFEAGWKMPNLLERLNTLVFFWPGTKSGPIQKGRDHGPSTDGPGDTMTLRVPAREAFIVGKPLFCKYNSGSPRHTSGRPSPRGPDTFLTEVDFRWTPSKVAEVVFEHDFALPSSTQVFDQEKGCWKAEL